MNGLTCELNNMDDGECVSFMPFAVCMMLRLMCVEHVNDMNDITHKPSAVNVFALGGITCMMGDKNKLTLSRRGCGLC